MSESADCPLPQDAAGALQQRVAALRSEGTWRGDPVRFRYLEGLAARLQGQPACVQRVLHERLQAAVTDFDARVEQRQQAARAQAESLITQHPAQAGALRRLQAAGDIVGMRRLLAAAQAKAACAPLLHLNESIRAARRGGDAAAGEPADANELASARRFRGSWDRHRSEQQVEQALARKPVQAGPLNSHVLVLQSLELMRELSPDYLRRFLAQVESLQWLEHSREVLAPVKQGKAKAAKAAKARRPKR
jgi:hypothetical protein